MLGVPCFILLGFFMLSTVSSGSDFLIFFALSASWRAIGLYYELIFLLSKLK